MRPLAVIIFGFFCLAPLAATTGTWLWPWPHPSSMPAVPPVPLSVFDFEQFNKWFVDRVRRHLPLLAVNTAYQVGLLYRSTNPRIVFGSDAWLFYTDESDNPGTMANFRGKLRFTDAEVQHLERELIAMRDALSVCGIHALVAVAPNKQSIYGEYLFVTDRHVKTAIDDLLSRMSPEAHAMLLDLRPALRAAKVREANFLLYYKTDTHWNQLGAFYAYHTIIETLAKTMAIPNLPLASLDQFTLYVQPYDGDIPAILRAGPWFSDAGIQMRPKANPAVPPEAGQMVLLGDSFAKALGPYFRSHFSDIRFVPFVNTGAALEGAHPKPSLVLLEIVERYLPYLVKFSFDWTRFCAR
jgi:hypothetical protein